MSGSPAPTAPAAPTNSGEYASWSRRILALFVDWAGCQLVLIASEHLFGLHINVFYPTALFWLESGVGVALAGGSFGQLACRIRVRRLDGRPVELLPSLLRAFLVCLVIPPLVYKPDGRGLHDMAVGSAAYRLL